MALSVRPALPGDAATVTGMVAELSAHEGAPRPDFSVRDFRRDGFGPNAAFTTLLAELDGAPVGYAMYHRSYDTIFGQRGSYLLDLYVSDKARMKGVGRALMAAVARATREAGGSFVWWHMQRDNDLAEGFYRKVGRPRGDLVVWATSGKDFARLLED